MPPRKKAAAAATDATADTGANGTAAAADDAPAPRRSSRVRAASTQPDDTPAAAASAPAKKAPASKAKAPASKTKAPASKAKAPAKGKGKRALADVGEDDDKDDSADAKDDDAAEPEKKKAKKAPAKGKGKASAKADDDDADDADVKMDDAADDKEEDKKMVSIKKLGAAPVDEHSGMVDTHQVLVAGGTVWDCMLNQTDLGKNANKYYVIQLLHPIGNENTCILYTRWGRVGENGQKGKNPSFPQATAISEFKKQFKAKAATDWENRVGMTAKKGKYFYIERSFGDDEEEKEEKEDIPEEKIPDSALAPQLQDFVKIVFNSSFVSAALTEMNYDARKLPLGKLAKSTLLQGFAALKELAEVINDPNGKLAKEHGGWTKACQALSGQYYSIIPHAFGRNIPTSINDQQLLKRELELVDALGDMQVAQKLISSSIPRDDAGNPLNPLDARFRGLGLTSMDPVDRQSTEFAALDKYVQDTHGETHRHYKVAVQHVFRVEREAETQAWNKAGHNKLKDGERLLLWHGSRSTNFAGILSQGLRIAPPEAPVTGYMFGKGVYFADMMSKSANYCHSHLSDDIGVLLLCEVAAQPYHELLQSDYHADDGCKKAKKMCTKGIGRVQPTEWKDAGEALSNDVLKGCHMPANKGIDVGAQYPGAYLQYNEYIVYDVSQIRVRYLLMVKMR